MKNYISFKVLKKKKKIRLLELGLSKSIMVYEIQQQQKILDQVYYVPFMRHYDLQLAEKEFSILTK